MRELLQKLLAKGALDQPGSANETSPTLYVGLVRERLGAYLSNISEESWKWTEKIDAMLGAFHWPESYRKTIEDAIEHSILLVGWIYCLRNSVCFTHSCLNPDRLHNVYRVG